MSAFWQKLRNKKTFYSYAKPPVKYHSITVVEKTPPNSEINDGDFILVRYKRKDVWALFQCPCGCKEVISLSLKKIHQKRWQVKKTKSKRPSLYPSIAQTYGCYSHFWIEDGRVYWSSVTIEDRS